MSLHMKNTVDKVLKEFSQDKSNFNRGAIALLHSMQIVLERIIDDCNSSFTTDCSFADFCITGSGNFDIDSDTDSSEC